MTNFQPRVETLTVKVSPELKSLIKEEMTAQGESSLSCYLHQIIDRRHDASENIGELKRRMLHLEAENAELRRQTDYPLPHQDIDATARIQKLELQVRAEKQQRFELQKELTQTQKERAMLTKIQAEQIPHWMDITGYEQLTKSLKKLHQQFPNHDFQMLLLKTLQLVEHNEKSFNILRMKHILSQNSKK